MNKLDDINRPLFITNSHILFMLQQTAVFQNEEVLFNHLHVRLSMSWPRG